MQALKSLYIYIYMWAIYDQYKPFTNIYGFHIYVFSLYLAIFIHYALRMCHFGMFQRCYPISKSRVLTLILSWHYPLIKQGGIPNTKTLGKGR